MPLTLARWYKDGDNKNGESRLAGKSFFDTGQVHANELKSTVPGQMYFDENGEILTDIGQPVAEIEQQTEAKQDIIDFNKKKVGN